MSAIKDGIVNMLTSEGVQKAVYTTGVIGMVYGASRVSGIYSTNMQVYNAINASIKDGKCRVYIDDSVEGVVRSHDVGGTVAYLTPTWRFSWEKNYLDQLDESRKAIDVDATLEINHEGVTVIISPTRKVILLHLYDQN